MIRTLHVDTGREMQGGQWQVLYLVERLKDATLLAPEGSPLLAEARKRGLPARPLRRLFGELRRADLVHAHDSRVHTYAALANFGRPLVVSRRVGFPVKQSIASHWKYLQATLFLAVSRYAAGKLRDAGVGRGVIRVVYDGIPIPASPSRPEPGRVVAVPSKYQEIPGIPVHLTMNLFDDLSTASVFLYVSEMEGLGSAAIAAMASGVPVVASGVGGLPEVVEHERTGLIVRDGDYAKAVRRLLDNPSFAAELGAAGREKAMREFSVEKMVQSTLDAYNEILR
ncbi:MAG: glycosyltransferase family 4 protein [Bryobacteraceae bacterium]